MDWASGFTEMKRSGIEVVARTIVSAELIIVYISGGDALRGNTRTHPEHDG